MKTKNKFLFIALGVVLLLSCAFLFSGCFGAGTVVQLYDGESLFQAATVTPNAVYELPVPEKTGYTFLGWYDSAEGGSAYTDKTGSSVGLQWQEDGPTALYAHWDANEYKITFDYEDSTAVGGVTEMAVTYGAEIKGTFPVPQKTGYSFDGWYTKKDVKITDGSGVLTADAKVYVDSVYPLDEIGTTLVPKWTQKKITFLFSTEGSAVKEVSYAVGTVLKDLPVSILDNHCFEGWYLDSMLLTPVSFPYTVTDSMGDVVTLYANHVEASLNDLFFQTISSTADREYEVSYEGSGNLTELVIPDSYYGKKVTRVKKISGEFLEEVLLPQTVKELGAAAFYGCTSLKKINLPQGLTSISKEAFAGCAALEAIKIPAGVKNIYQSAFAGCTSITTLTLPASLETLGETALSAMLSLKEIVVEEENARFFTEDGVLYLKSGNSVHLVAYPAAKEAASFTPNAATTKILPGAFMGCTLSDITINSKLTSIGDYAFFHSTNLTFVKITSEASSLSFGEYAFAYCSSLQALMLETNAVPTLDGTTFANLSPTFSVYVTSNKMQNYQNASNWRNYKDRIFSVGTIVGDFALETVDGGFAIRQYFGSAKKVVIPDRLNAKDVVGISANAFLGSDVEEITLPSTVTFIGSGAFASCENLQRLILECAPPAMGDGIFEGANEELTIYIKNTPDVLDSYHNDASWGALADRIWSYQGSND